MKIDEKCVSLVTFFNKRGLTTKFSCEGHGRGPFEIMFDESVNEESIKDFLENYEVSNCQVVYSGRFVKWGRFLEGKFQTNWIYTVLDAEGAERDYLRFTRRLEDNVFIQEDKKDGN